VAKRKHCYIIEMALTFLLDANLPGQLWVDTDYASTYVINRLPTPLLDNHSCFGKLFHKVPKYSFLLVFGCECFPILLTQLHKLALQSKNVFVLVVLHIIKGTSLDPTIGRVYISCHVLFHEDVFPYLDLQNFMFKFDNISPLSLVIPLSYLSVSHPKLSLNPLGALDPVLVSHLCLPLLV